MTDDVTVGLAFGTLIHEVELVLSALVLSSQGYAFDMLLVYVYWLYHAASVASAAGARAREPSGVWKRTFAAGVVYANEPGNATQTVNFGRTWHTIAGAAMSEVTLGGAHGVVLVP